MLQNGDGICPLPACVRNIRRAATGVHGGDNQDYPVRVAQQVKMDPKCFSTRAWHYRRTSDRTAMRHRGVGARRRAGLPANVVTEHVLNVATVKRRARR